MPPPLRGALENPKLLSASEPEEAFARERHAGVKLEVEAVDVFEDVREEEVLVNPGHCRRTRDQVSAWPQNLDRKKFGSDTHG